MIRSRPISLIAAFYRNETEAGEMLAQLKTMDKDGTVDIIDAAVMVKAEDGRKLKITETAELTAKKGGVLGIIFPPSILATAAVGAALGHFTDQGFNNNLLKEIGEGIPPGGSCIIAVVDKTWLRKLLTVLEGYFDLAGYGLDAEAAAKLTAALQR